MRFSLDQSLLTPWLHEALKQFVDSDAADLVVDYVNLLLQRSEDSKSLRRSCIEELTEFLNEDTTSFVNKLFDAIDADRFTARGGSDLEGGVGGGGAVGRDGRKRGRHGDDHDAPQREPYQSKQQRHTNSIPLFGGVAIGPETQAMMGGFFSGFPGYPPGVMGFPHMAMPPFGFPNPLMFPGAAMTFPMPLPGMPFDGQTIGVGTVGEAQFTVRCSNIPLHFKESELFNHFKHFGRIDKLILIPTNPPHDSSSGSVPTSRECDVQFRTAQQARKCLESPSAVLNNRFIRVAMAPADLIAAGTSVDNGAASGMGIEGTGSSGDGEADDKGDWSSDADQQRESIPGVGSSDNCLTGAGTDARPSHHSASGASVVATPAALGISLSGTQKGMTGDKSGVPDKAVAAAAEKEAIKRQYEIVSSMREQQNSLHRQKEETITVSVYAFFLLSPSFSHPSFPPLFMITETNIGFEGDAQETRRQNGATVGGGNREWHRCTNNYTKDT